MGNQTAQQTETVQVAKYNLHTQLAKELQPVLRNLHSSPTGLGMSLSLLVHLLNLFIGYYR